MPPQALGEDIEVPFIIMLPCSVQLDTGAIAPPGALKSTPRLPSNVGPRDDQVYWMAGMVSRSEYCASIMVGETYAPMPKIAEVVPPGEPTVERAGPLLPALATKMTPCLLTISEYSPASLPSFGSCVGPP